MEPKAHRSYKDNVLGQMSRLERDLLSSTHRPEMYTNGARATMLRSKNLQGRIPHVCVVGAGISGMVLVMFSIE